MAGTWVGRGAREVEGRSETSGEEEERMGGVTVGWVAGAEGREAERMTAASGAAGERMRIV